MLSVRTVKEIRGSVTLPPDPDLYPVAIMAALASRIPVTIAPIAATVEFNAWTSLFSGLCALSEKDGTVSITVPESLAGRRLDLADESHPFIDFLTFCGLGMGMPVSFSHLSLPRRERWQQIAIRSMCQLDVVECDGRVQLSIRQNPAFNAPADPIEPDDLHSFMGLALGLGSRVSIELEYYPASPLRHLLPALGYNFEVRSNAPGRIADPILKRIYRMKAKKRSGSAPEQTFTLTADFSKRPVEPAALTLPGDAVLFSLLLAAKSIAQKGSLVIANAPTELWATQTLQLIRKMNGTPALQETVPASFGGTGLVTLQHFTCEGRKTEALPWWQFNRHMAPMIVIALFSEGESVFRRLDEMHWSDPDTIAQCLSFLRTINAHHGELSDGIVIKGAHHYDGFDIPEELPAQLAGAWAIVALKCLAESKIADTRLHDRWPGFKEMLDSICEYRE
jgi:hypothetical protein